eukprot:6211845-Pleurochrysis_carterae.AAC.2
MTNIRSKFQVADMFPTHQRLYSEAQSCIQIFVNTRPTAPKIATRLPETAEALNHVHTTCGYADDIAGTTLQVPTAVAAHAQVPVVHVAFSFAADKKGVEAQRDCSPSCPCCFCGRPNLHLFAWHREEAPTTYVDMLRQLRQVCAGIVSSTRSARLRNHLLSPGPRCSFCHSVSFETEQQREKKRSMLAELRASSRTADQNKYDSLRKAHTTVHAGTSTSCRCRC